jgi:hypothetical protein
VVCFIHHLPPCKVASGVHEEYTHNIVTYHPPGNLSLEICKILCIVQAYRAGRCPPSLSEGAVYKVNDEGLICGTGHRGGSSKPADGAIAGLKGLIPILRGVGVVNSDPALLVDAPLVSNAVWARTLVRVKSFQGPKSVQGRVPRRRSRSSDFSHPCSTLWMPCSFAQVSATPWSLQCVRWDTARGYT